MKRDSPSWRAELTRDRLARVSLWVIVSGLGKIASAVRDLVPAYFFGVGRVLDQAVLAAFSGTMLGSIALTTAMPLLLPRFVAGERSAPAFALRFAAFFTAAAILLLVLQNAVFKALSVESTGELVVLYMLALAAGVTTAFSATLAARLHSQRTNAAALAIPFFGGPTMVIAMIASPTFVSLGVALLVGALLDVGGLMLLARRHVEPRTSAAEIPRPTQYFIVSQALVLAIIFAERAIASRGVSGLAGATSISNRVAFSIVAVIAGSIAPSLVRALASATAKVSWTHVLARGVGAAVIASILSLTLTVSWVLIAEPPLLLASMCVFGAAVPAMVAHRSIQALLFGKGSYLIDLSLVIVGGIATLGIASAGLYLGNTALLIAAIPISSTISAVTAYFLAPFHTLVSERTRSTPTEVASGLT